MHNQNKRKARTALVLTAAFLLAIPFISAAELGMNYYHETMMGAWGGQYMPRTDNEIRNDLNDIKSVTRYIKLYANPMIDGNVEHAKKVARMAKDNGMHVVITMNTEDRELNDGNWWDYRNRVQNACREFNGLADEFIVGNEIGLKSPWDSQGTRNRVEPLINDCAFNGPKTYEAFFWDRDAWKSYDGKIYLNTYEHFPLFSQNIDELSSWKHKPLIGEWGDNFGSENDQADQIRMRWDKIQGSPVERAYVFTYKEPSNSGTFGVVRKDGSKKPAWYALPRSGSAPKQQEPAPTQTTQSSGTWNVGQLKATMSADGAWKKQDTVVGECRLFEYGTSSGDAKVLACKKGEAVEMYTQNSPSNNWKFTLSSGSVGSHTGYSRFVPKDGQTTTQTQTAQPTKTTSGASLKDLSVSFSSDAGQWKVEDRFDGCRTIRYGTNAGEAKVLACEKGSDVEMYTQSSPNTKWKLTLGGGTVGSDTGFARFSPTGNSDQGTKQPAATTTSSANGWSASHNGRLNSFEDMGACKKASFNTDAGYIEGLACDKGGHWEMYLKSGVNGATISYNGMTVGVNAGFARA